MVKILQGDCREVLKTLPDGSVNCCVTSPPYFGLRDYKVDGQIGLEQTPDAYVAELVAVFREVRRVLREDGTLWLNLGDSYAAQRGGTCMPAETLAGGVSGTGDEKSYRGRPGGAKAHEVNRHTQYMPARNASSIGLKHKDLIGIPWRVAFALQADGWYLRQDIIWSKPNPMPESVKDRCCKSHEYVFLLSKSERYYFDSDAIKEDVVNGNKNVQQVQDHAAAYMFQQEQPTSGRTDGGVQGVSLCDTDSVESEIQQNHQSAGGSGTILLLRKGTNGEKGVSEIIRDDTGATGAIQDGGADTRKRAEVQGAAAEVRHQREGVCGESGTGSPVCANRQGAVLQAEDRNQAEASDQAHGLHVDARTVGGDQEEVRLSVRVLQPPDGAAGDGSRHAAIEGRGAHSGEHCSGVSDVQRQEGREPACYRGSKFNKGKTAIHQLSRSSDSPRVTGNLPGRDDGGRACNKTGQEKRNKRSVWTVCTQPYKGAHFATFPPKLISPMILAGCPVGGTVLDPFGGSGTTGEVAEALGRNSILIELNPAYIELEKQRTAQMGLGL